MKPLIKNLIGGVVELHTREYLLKISAQTMGCRERSKISSKSSKNASSRCRTRVLGKKERERGEEDIPGDGVCAPQAPCGHGQGAGRASRAPGQLVPPWSVP